MTFYSGLMGIDSARNALGSRKRCPLGRATLGATTIWRCAACSVNLLAQVKPTTDDERSREAWVAEYAFI